MSINFFSGKPTSKTANYSYLNFFNLPSGDNNVELRTKFRQIGVFYWACLLFPPYFIIEQYVAFQTTRYWPILITLYVLLIIAPIIYKHTHSLRLYSVYTVTLGVSIVYTIIACAGGNLSPGAFWIVGTPMVFGLFYGIRGVWIGTVVMAVTFSLFVTLNHFRILPNLVAENGYYDKAKFVNLILFGLYNVLISYYFIQLEEKAKVELRQQRQEIESLLRILVHDVANPINAVQLMTYAAKSGQRQPEQILDLIDGVMEDLASIVQQVSKLRALKDGKLALELSTVALQVLLLDVLSMLREQAEAKGVVLDCQLPAQSINILSDAALLKSVVFANIIGNAIKFSHSGRVVQISLSATNEAVQVKVQDQGIGIPTDLLPHLFNPSVPTTRVGTNGERGTGFGMPLVKTLLTKLNGEIEVSSSQDTGATGTLVTVKLPRHKI